MKTMVNELIDGWMGESVDEWIDERMDGCIIFVGEILTNELMKRLDGWIFEWRN